jgi:hypothetical protein
MNRQEMTKRGKRYQRKIDEINIHFQIDRLRQPKDRKREGYSHKKQINRYKREIDVSNTHQMDRRGQ